MVEKPRPRESVETGVHPRRDPALLEWTGGSVFKTRVFPIPGRSEKRITLAYTQVLPLRGGSYRYRCALQNDMLKGHPLRQLEIDVRVSSTLPLRRVASPTHVTRNSLTDHSARVEFNARDYVPAQDFEVVVDVADRRPDVVMIPQCCGEDGYFMLQLSGGDCPDFRPA